MKLRFLLHPVLAVAGLVLTAPGVRADIMTDQLNTITYTNREQLATYTPTANGGTYANTNTLAVGDHIYGVVVATTEQPNPAPPNATAIFDIVVAKIIDPTTGNSVTPTPNSTVEVLFTTDSAKLSSGETGGFLTGTGSTYTLADGSHISGLGQTPNSLQAVYQGANLTTLTLDNSGLPSLTPTPQGTDITAAHTGGTLYGDFGLGAALTDNSNNSQWGASGIGYWVSNVTLNSTGAIVAPSGGLPFAFGNIDLTPPPPPAGFVGLYNPLVGAIANASTGANATSIENNYGASPLGPGNGTTFDYVGGGTATGNNSYPTTSAWPTTSADPTWIYPTPEPGTMLMMGMGLVMGLPYLRRQRKAVA